MIIKYKHKVHDCDYHPDVFHNNAKWQGIFDSRIFGAPIFHLTIANRLSKLNQSPLLENKPLLLPWSQSKQQFLEPQEK